LTSSPSPGRDDGLGYRPQGSQAAKIPVILTDRSIETKDPSLYVTMIGSDFTEEGRKAAKWLLENYKARAM
jgi:ABC-type sugar transport system substrate-binding protein